VFQGNDIHISACFDSQGPLTIHHIIAIFILLKFLYLIFHDFSFSFMYFFIFIAKFWKSSEDVLQHHGHEIIFGLKCLNQSDSSISFATSTSVSLAFQGSGVIETLIVSQIFF
jgi:hypothetical protein